MNVTGRGLLLSLFLTSCLEFFFLFAPLSVFTTVKAWTRPVCFTGKEPRVLSAKSFPSYFSGHPCNSSLHVFRLLFSASLPCSLWAGSAFCLFMKQRREIFLFRLVGKRTNKGQKTEPAFLFPGSRPGSMTPSMGQKA